MQVFQKLSIFWDLDPRLALSLADSLFMMGPTNPHQRPNLLVCLKSGAGSSGEFLRLSLLLSPAQSTLIRSVVHAVEATQP